MSDYSNSGSGGLDYYNGEPVLFMDEYKGSLKFSQFLVMLDSYRTQIHCRYANVYALWSEVHITSVYPPEEAYSFMVDIANRRTDSIAQLLRRLTEVIYHFKDGKEYKTYELPATEYINYADLKRRIKYQNTDFCNSRSIEQLEIPFDK